MKKKAPDAAEQAEKKDAEERIRLRTATQAASDSHVATGEAIARKLFGNVQVERDA